MQFTVFTLFPAEQRGFAMGLAGVVVQSAPAIGPTLTGLFVDLFSWRMPFLSCFSNCCGSFYFRFLLRRK